MDSRSCRLRWNAKNCTSMLLLTFRTTLNAINSVYLDEPHVRWKSAACSCAKAWLGNRVLTHLYASSAACFS